MNTTCFSILSLLCCSNVLLSQSYHVASGGSDSNPGTASRPWRTISKAASVLSAGDTVFIHGGVYHESIIPARSGAPGSPITYRNWAGEEVIVDGGKEAAGWVRDGGNRYRISINFTPSPRFSAGGFTPQGNKGGGLILQDGVKMDYLMAESPSEVDTPGEYYLNDSAGTSPPHDLYVCVRDLGKGLDPNNYKMIVGRFRKGFDLDNGADYITIDGLTVCHFNDNAIHTIGSRHCRFHGLTLLSNYITGIYLTANSTWNEIRNCEFRDNGHGGIELARSDSNRISANVFSRRGGPGGYGGNGCHIWIGPLTELSHGNVVENNVAFSTGSAYASAGFVVIRGNGNTIRNNSSTDYDQGERGGMGGGITLLDGSRNVVVNNIVYTEWGASPIAVFPDAVLGGGHLIQFNDFHTTDSTERFWWNGVRYSSLSAWEAASGQRNNICRPPGFKDIAGGDLHLRKDSECIDSGTLSSAPTEDFDGNGRPAGNGIDIGAYEYQLPLYEERDAPSPGIPLFVLEQNIPNPFREETIIRVRCPACSQAHEMPVHRTHAMTGYSLKIYDLMGRELADFSDAVTANGDVRVRGSLFPSDGIYYYRLSTPHQSTTRAMLVVR